MDTGFFKRNKIMGINVLYILSIIPVILFAFYKNGIAVWQKGNISFFLATQYLVIPIVIILLSYVFETYYYLGIKKDTDNHRVVNSIAPYINALCYLVCGPTNYLWLTIPLIIVADVSLKFIDHKVSINQVALFKCVLFLILTIIGVYNNANFYEQGLDNTITNVTSLFVGNGVGEIGTTSSLCALIGFVILLFNNYYKKDVPIICFVGYALVSLIIYFAGAASFNDILVNTFNSGFLFACVFVVSLSNSTPVVKGGRVIYSLLVGVLCAVMVNAFHFNVGIYFSILVVSLLTPILNKLRVTFE